MVENRPAVPETTNFNEILDKFKIKHDDLLCLFIPVSLTESCRVKFFQQEVGHDVEGILVWFVKHVSDDHKNMKKG